MRIRLSSPIAALTGLTAIVALTVGTLSHAAVAKGAGNTIRIEPATQTVQKDASFTVRIVGNASVPLSGLGASITYDKAKLKITNVVRGPSWLDAQVNVPANIQTAIATANTKGKLLALASAYFPPDAVPPGDADFVTVTFTAIGCGRVTLGLPVGPLDGTMLDGRDATYGKVVKPTTTAGKVTVQGDCPVATPKPSGTSPATTTAPGATPTPIGSTGASEVPSPSASVEDVSPSPTGGVEGSTGAPSSSPSEPIAIASVAATAAPTSPAIVDTANSSGGPPVLALVLALIAVIAVGGGALWWRSSRGAG